MEAGGGRWGQVETGGDRWKQVETLACFALDPLGDGGLVCVVSFMLTVLLAWNILREAGALLRHLRHELRLWETVRDREYFDIRATNCVHSRPRGFQFERLRLRRHPRLGSYLRVARGVAMVVPTDADVTRATTLHAAG